ncbi:hypothetical protein GGR53DRAFT_481940 [Hypoxylon sp. FL1150]|nr:hypothetical protein GGR53DRAFT_481940 [Hypoxylon sp. FL1150]
MVGIRVAVLVRVLVGHRSLAGSWRSVSACHLDLALVEGLDAVAVGRVLSLDPVAVAVTIIVAVTLTLTVAVALGRILSLDLDVAVVVRRIAIHIDIAVGRVLLLNLHIAVAVRRIASLDLDVAIRRILFLNLDLDVAVGRIVVLHLDVAVGRVLLLDLDVRLGCLPMLGRVSARLIVVRVRGVRGDRGERKARVHALLGDCLLHLMGCHLGCRGRVTKVVVSVRDGLVVEIVRSVLLCKGRRG